MVLSFSFFFLFPVGIIWDLRCEKAFHLVSLISVSSSSFSNNMWISVYVSLINILDFCFYRKLEELLIIFPVKSRFWWVTWSNLFGSSQPYFLNVSSVTLTLYGCLPVAYSITTKWNFLTSLCFCAIHSSGRLLLTSSSHTGPLPFEFSKYLLSVSLIFYLILQSFCGFFPCDHICKILWTIRFSICIRTKGLVSNPWPLCSSYRC